MPQISTAILYRETLSSKIGGLLHSRVAQVVGVLTSHVTMTAGAGSQVAPHCPPE